MKSPRVVELRADWVELIEVLHASNPDEHAWASDVRDAARPLVPDADLVGVYCLEYGADFSLAQVPFNLPPEMSERFASLESILSLGGEYATAWVPYHFAAPVATSGQITSRVGEGLRREMEVVQARNTYVDGFAVIAHPLPGVIAVLHAVFPVPIDLQSAERQALTRVALHLESSFRARRLPEKVMGEVSGRGKILWRDDEAPSNHVLGSHSERIVRARTSRARKSSDAIELWHALVAGRSSLVPRSNGYLVLENEPKGHGLRTLSIGESTVLGLAAKGLPTKVIAYGQGISTATVSNRLASAAAKIGVMTRTELVRVAAMLSADHRVTASETDLTAAEEEILDLLRRGLSNRQIAAARSRSLRTVANQVASLLRKTKTGSRRALVAKA